MKKSTVFTTTIVGLFFLSGWIINLVKLTKLDFKQPYKAEVIRLVGITPPVGGIIGWIHIDDTPQA